MMEKKSNPHAFGVDDTASISISNKANTLSAWMMNPDLDPVPNSILGLGHFSQALPGHFCEAPKPGPQHPSSKGGATGPLVRRGCPQKVALDIRVEIPRKFEGCPGNYPVLQRTFWSIFFS
jgi:hypothetical protein